MNAATAQRQQVDAVAEQLAAGDWPTDNTWPYDYPKPAGRSRFKEYSGRHRAGDERIGVPA